MLTRKPSQNTIMQATYKKVPKLTATQIAAAELIAKKRGSTPTYNEIADQVGISPRQLHRWRLENNDFQAYIKDRVLAELICQLPELMDTLYKKAIKTGSSKHLELSFQLLGMLSTNTNLIVHPGPERRPTNQELEESIRELEAELEEFDKDRENNKIIEVEVLDFDEE